MSRETDEKRELLKLKQGLIEQSDIIETDVKPEPVKLTPAKWIENFLYRNKFYVLAAAFMIFVAVVLLTQLLTKEAPDIRVLVVSSDREKTPTLYQKINDIELALEQYCPDFDNNGNVHVEVYYMDLSVTADSQYNYTNSAKFFGEIELGVAQLFICDTGIFGTTSDAEDAPDFDYMCLDIGKTLELEQYDGATNIPLLSTEFVKDAKWESTCPDVLGFSLKNEREGLISYSDKALKNNEKAREVLKNILTNNKINEPKPEKEE